ncbi:DNA cytosine methyltransferase [Smaragdicoccus niigatensis]|uniref:DNA cytosine methyltransferase n=1 Tax=Smaragdicoccus niigatensis TaxID=359359 RepID=UPI000371BD2D|nr:DNA cytosine methyltransferase [Smaragdicoccus niigatensis]
MTNSALTAIDTFAGAGGVSLGLAWAGFDVRAAFDFNVKAVDTYRRNLAGHIIEASSEELSAPDLLGLAGLGAGEVDLLAGGPPCQGFSVQRRGSDVDPRNALIGDYLRHIQGLRPRAFMMENVPALAGRRGDAILAEFTSGASALGYSVAMQILDAADYGVPQHRRRLFVVGLLGARAFEFPAPTHNSQTWLTVRDAIGDLADPRLSGAVYRLANHDPDNVSDMNRIRISHVPEGGGRDDIPWDLRLPCHRVPVEVSGHRAVYGRLWWDRPASTVTTKCNSFTRGRFAHPAQDRNISMREAARLQGFPDEFVFQGGRVDVAHQVGNAVPPLLAMTVGAAIAKQLNQ